MAKLLVRGAPSADMSNGFLIFCGRGRISDWTIFGI